MSTESAFKSWFDSQGFRNFKGAELTWYFGKVRSGVANTYPPRLLWDNIVPTLRILDRLRDHLARPITLTSTYRAPSYNRAIGSPDGSMHRQFRAADFKVAGVDPRDVAAVLKLWRGSGDFRGGIGTYRTFVHLDTRAGNATW